MSSFVGVSNPHSIKRRRKDKFFKTLCTIAALIAVTILVVLLYTVVRDGMGRLSWDFINSMPSSFRPAQAGIKSPLMGSLFVMVLTLLFVVPIGVAAAVYMEEFTPRKNALTRFIQVNIGNLAGVPSIVFGMLGLTLFVILAWFWQVGFGRGI